MVKEWLTIEPLLPNKLRGVPRVDDRRVLNGILWPLSLWCAMGRGPRTLWSVENLLQLLHPLAKSRSLGLIVGRGFRRLQRRVGDDRFHLHARPPAPCDGQIDPKGAGWH